jgi:hypothetical protein
MEQARTVPTTVYGLDVARVRGLYLTMGAGIAHLDGPLSMLQPSPSCARS